VICGAVHTLQPELASDSAPLVNVIFMPSFCSSIARRYSSPRTAYSVRLTAAFRRSGCNALPSLLATEAEAAARTPVPRTAKLSTHLKVVINRSILLMLLGRCLRAMTSYVLTVLARESYSRIRVPRLARNRAPAGS
jgi:hypothetical protein